MARDGSLIVSRDAYADSFANFMSCSYVPEYIKNCAEINVVGGSRICLLEIAKEEIGYQETPVNITKYGKWFNKDGFEWCAMFVCWCAHQANIAETVIPKNAGCEGIQQFFNSNGRFYLSLSRGGSYTPQAGDLYFERGETWSPDHIGIVASVSGQYMYVIDGNCNDKVNYHSISLTASDLIGFAKPNYSSSTHQYSSAWTANQNYHWKGCVNCGYSETKTAHSFKQLQTGGPYICTICGYETYSIPLAANKTLQMQERVYEKD